MRLVHLTDPHLSSLDGERFLNLRGKRWSGYLSWKKNRRKKFLPAVLNKLVDSVRAEQADKILLTGDLIQIGLDSEIAQATDWLSTVGPAEQVMLIPGNHDTYARGSADAVFREWSEFLFHGNQRQTAEGRKEFPVLRKHGKISFIGLSTACVTPVFMATGTLGDSQLKHLAQLLEQAAGEGQLVCLLIHHPPLPGMTKWRKALTDAHALQAVLERHPPPVILHGHLHHNREIQWGESRIYCTAAASCASDASYRVIDIEEIGDCWEFHMTLKSCALENENEFQFATVDEQLWQVQK